MNSLEKRFCEIETKRQELRALCSQMVEEYETTLLFQVQEFMKSIRDQLNNVSQDDHVIYNKTKDEIEKVIMLEEQIQQIQKILYDFTHHSQHLFLKKVGSHGSKEEPDEKNGLGVNIMESDLN
jgi:hypothetical protein